jgi:glutamine amidotransferase
VISQEAIVCELLGMSSLVPATVTLSMEELARRGGDTGMHVDGWGLGVFRDADAELIREPRAAHDSARLHFLQEHPLRTHIALAHIRKATVGARKLANTQPFRRELGGRVHMFAHNGDLSTIARAARPAVNRFHPLGDTDSEWAFLVLLELMELLWDGRLAPTLADRLDVVGQFARWLRDFGPANFMYSDGEILFVHGHRRTQPNGRMAAPGLHWLSRTCEMPELHDFGGVRFLPRIGRQQVVLVASVPLTDEPWEPLDEGQVLAIRDGVVVDTVWPLSFVATNRRAGLA